jgi:hypothetical protein
MLARPLFRKGQDRHERPGDSQSEIDACQTAFVANIIKTADNSSLAE